MAELIVGALLGTAVSELYKLLTHEIELVHHRNRNLDDLKDRLDRLKPLVHELSFIGSEDSHPAGKWLSDVSQELHKAVGLVSKCRGSHVSLMRHSGSFERINGKIGELVNDANIIGLVQQRRNLQLDPAHMMGPPYGRWWGASRDGSLISPSHVGGQLHWGRACRVPTPPPKTFGRDTVARSQIQEMVNEDSYNKWIVLWGMGGVGKTCAALRVYHDKYIKQHFTGGVFWVTVSKDQAPPLLILRQLCVKINEERAPSTIACDLAAGLPADLEAARLEVKSLLDRDKVLLILDDVRDSRFLQGLDVVSESRKGVIFLTTRDKGILNFVSNDEERRRRIAECAKIVEFPRLSDEDGWELFSWHAFHSFRKSIPDDLKGVAVALSKECKGLPLALEGIGSSMGATHLSPEDLSMGRSLEGEWEDALKALRGANSKGLRKKVFVSQRSGSHHEFDEDTSLYDRLQWSLDTLVEQPCLKDCLSYFAAYPGNCAVSVKELLRFWVAEGLCDEQKGGDLLGVLLAKSVIEYADVGRRTCKIHDIMRHLVHLNLQFNTQEDSELPVSERQCLYAPGQKLTQFPASWTAPGVQLSAKRVSLLDNCLQDFPPQFDAPNLRVLILRKNNFSAISSRFMHSPTFFANLNDLRVLDLSETQIEKIPRSLFRRLKSLVLLDLSNCTKLKKISDEIGSLQYLETLLLDGLQLLRWLPSMKGLAKLQTLSISLHSFWLGDSISHVFQLLSLQRLQIDGGIPELTDGRSKYDLPAISSLTALKEFRIRRCQLPRGLTELRRLRVLEIHGADIETLPSLENLPDLEELTIRGCGQIVSFPESFGGRGAFPSLRMLSLIHLEECRSLFECQVGALPRLQMLALWRLDALEEFPRYLKRLPALKSLYLDQNGISVIDYRRLFDVRDAFPCLAYLYFAPYGSIPELPLHIQEREKEGILRIETRVPDTLWES